MTWCTVSTEETAVSPRRLKFSEQIRRAIESSGETRYRISVETGVSQTTLSRFMHDKGGLSTDVLDRIAEYLRLELKTPQRRKG